MRDQDRTNQQLISDLEELRRRVAVLETAEVQHRRTEEALRQSEKTCRTLIETLPETMVLADLQGNITFVSHRILELHGSETVEDFLGRHTLDFIVPEDHQRFLVNLKRTLEEGVTRAVEYTFIRKDGTRFPGEVSGAVIRDAAGEPQSLMALVRDITERKQAQEAIRESEVKLRTLFQILPIGISILDEHRRIVDLNPALGQILGMTKETLLAGGYKGRQYIRSDGSPMPPEEYPSALAMKEGTVVSNVEVGVVKEDGTKVWTSVSAAPLRLSGLGAAVVTRDITGYKQALEALRCEHRTLKHLLRASDHERQLIAYDIHDELAQQLTGAIMQFEVFDHLKKLKPRLAAKAYHAAMRMLRQGHFEARRLIAGVRPPVLDASGVVEAVEHLVNEARRQTGPTIDFRKYVEFDRLAPTLESAIYRIVQESLSNACRHSKSKKVRVSLLQRNDRVRVEIQDWGIGFDVEAVQEDCFGLEGIRQRARLLGGKCSVRSRPDQGTRVTVELPLAIRE